MTGSKIRHSPRTCRSWSIDAATRDRQCTRVSRQARCALRSPFRSNRAQALLVIGGTGTATGTGRSGALARHSRLCGTPGPRSRRASPRWPARPVLAFAGIGRSGQIFRNPDGRGDRCAAKAASFPTIIAIRTRMRPSSLPRRRPSGLTLVTTEKDMVRLVGQSETAALAAAARTLAVTLVVEDAKAFAQLVRSVGE